MDEQVRRERVEVPWSWGRTAPEPVAVERAVVRLRARARREEDPPGWVLLGGWVAVFLVLFGLVAGGLAVGAATALGWALARSWPRPRPAGAVARCG